MNTQQIAIDPITVIAPVVRASRKHKKYQSEDTRRGVSLHLAHEIKNLKENPRFAPFAVELEIVIRKIRRKGALTEADQQFEILRAIGQGAATAAEIAEDSETPRAEIKQKLDLLIETSVVRLEKRGGKTEVARGAQQKFYFLTQKGELLLRERGAKIVDLSE